MMIAATPVKRKRENTKSKSKDSNLYPRDPDNRKRGKGQCMKRQFIEEFFQRAIKHMHRSSISQKKKKGNFKHLYTTFYLSTLHG